MRISIVAIVWALSAAPTLAQAPDAAPPAAIAPSEAEQTPAKPAELPAELPPVTALPPEPPAAGGRFSFQKVDGGLLRLDSQSGQVAFCGPRSAGWTCQPVPEERAALEQEIARLQDQTAKLRSDLAALREPPAPRPPAELAPPAAKSDPKIKLPSAEDVERARAAIEDAWRRLMDMIVALQRDVMR